MTQEKITLGQWRPEDIHGKTVEFCILTPESSVHGSGQLDVSELSFHPGLFHVAIDSTHQISPGRYVSPRTELSQKAMDCLQKHPAKAAFHFRLVSIEIAPLPEEALFVLHRMGIDTNAFD